jgi:hypothetical protein
VPDRVAADNSSVETVRATLARAGRTDRPKVELPEAFEVPDDPVRVVLDGRTGYATVERSLGGTPELRAVYDSIREAREGEGESCLREWVEERGLAFDHSVLVDVVQPGRLYGLRGPGEHAVYEPRQRPREGADDLAAIADDIAEREGER